MSCSEISSNRPEMALLGPDGVREASARGMEVVSHSMAHRRLAGLEPGLLEEEVRASRALGGILGGPVEGFEQVDQALVPPVEHGRTAATLARGAQRVEEHRERKGRVGQARAKDLAGNPLYQNSSTSGSQLRSWVFKVKN